jgi:hypothetical protein
MNFAIKLTLNVAGSEIKVVEAHLFYVAFAQGCRNFVLKLGSGLFPIACL